MICYKDKTFCTAQCINHQCDRRLTPAVKQAAREWWGDDNGGAPIATNDFTNVCHDYMSGLQHR